MDHPLPSPARAQLVLSDKEKAFLASSLVRRDLKVWISGDIPTWRMVSEHQMKRLAKDKVSGQCHGNEASLKPHSLHFVFGVKCFGGEIRCSWTPWGVCLSWLETSMMRLAGKNGCSCEFHETYHSVTFYFMKKYSKQCRDITTPKSIHTKDESKRGSAFAFIFGANWPLQWM